MVARKKPPVVRDPVLDQEYDAVIGIDTSLTATGIAYVDLESGVWETWRIKSDGHLNDPIAERSRRLTKIVHDFERLIAAPNESNDHWLAVIEEPTFTSGGSGFDRAYMWHGIVRALLVRGHHVIQVNNSTGKVYAVGRASSPKVEKGEILAQVMKAHPSADIIDDNVADAVNLAALGARLIGRPVEQVAVTQTRLRALDSVRKKLGL